MILRGDRLQRVARAGSDRHAAIPQLGILFRRDDIAKRNNLAVGLGGRRGDLSDLRDDLLMDRIHLVDRNVQDLAMPVEIVAGVMAGKTLYRLDVAAAKHVLGQEDVDEPLDMAGTSGLRWAGSMVT